MGSAAVLDNMVQREESGLHERGEYDESEWREFRKKPNVPAALITN